MMEFGLAMITANLAFVPAATFASVFGPFGSLWQRNRTIPSEPARTLHD